MTRWALPMLAIAGGALASGLSEAAPAAHNILAWPGPAPQLRARDKSASEIANWNSGCKSWYLSEDGFNSTMYPGFATQFARQMASFELRDYRLV